MAWHVVNVPGLEWLKTINDTKVRVLNEVGWPGVHRGGLFLDLELAVCRTDVWGPPCVNRCLLFLDVPGLLDGTKVLVLNGVGWPGVQDGLRLWAACRQ